MLTIILPWPSPKLSPNARLHWRPKAEAVKLARAEAKYTAANALCDAAGDWRVDDVTVAMLWTFNPPDKRRYDRDNLIARCKAYQDGIADALTVDDSRFVPTYVIGSVFQGGRVVVAIGTPLEVGQALDYASLPF